MAEISAFNQGNSGKNNYLANVMADYKDGNSTNRAAQKKPSGYFLRNIQLFGWTYPLSKVWSSPINSIRSQGYSQKSNYRDIG